MEKSQKKFKTRELTKNEKVLLSLLTIVILFWLSYRFIYMPQQEKMSLLNSQRFEYEEKIEEINTILRKENHINQEWQDLHMEKEKIVSQYFPTLDQAQIIYILNELIENDEMSVSDLNFSRPIFSDIGGFQIRSMDISIPYSGKYDGIVSTINAIKQSPRKMLVDNIYIDRAMSKDLNGSMSLKIYSLEGIAESDKDVVYIDTANNEDRETPFAAYDDYSEEGVYEGSGGSEMTGQFPEIKPYIEEILTDFETNNNYFIPSHEFVKGEVSLSNTSKSKKHSLKLEYHILGIEEENRTFVDISKNNILFKYPPNTIGVWVYSYDYSPATLGLGFRSQLGKDILVSLSDGIGWTGWKYIETNPPSELDVYPLTLEHLYLEVSEGSDDYGVILFDKLEALYSRNLGEDGSEETVSNHMFHIVERGESIEGISKKFYGTNIYKNEIMKLNEIKPGEILPVGKVLVLKKR